jgi:hypothetical protein
MMESGLLGGEQGGCEPPVRRGASILQPGRGPPNLPPGSSYAPPSRRKMSTEEKPEKPREDDAQATPEWHWVGLDC